MRPILEKIRSSNLTLPPGPYHVMIYSVMTIKGRNGQKELAVGFEFKNYQSDKGRPHVAWKSFWYNLGDDKPLMELANATKIKWETINPDGSRIREIDPNELWDKNLVYTVTEAKDAEGKTISKVNFEPMLEGIPLAQPTLPYDQRVPIWVERASV